MAVDTRTVFAVAAAVVMTAGVVASLLDRDVLASRLIAVAFAIATFWAVLGLAWAANNPTFLGTHNYIALASMAAVATVYYGYKAANGVGFTDRL